MSKGSKKKGLGRGLGALLDNTDIQLSAEKEKVYEIDINEISPQDDQPRKHFDQEKLLELADSIKQDGILQPIILHQVGPGNYQIVAGERRWRAARLAGLKHVPAIIRELNDETMLRHALVENVQRQDLNAIEEAQAYQQLMDAYGLTQEALANAIGKSRSAIANTLRLNNLAKEVQAFIIQGDLSEGHGRALLILEDQDQQVAVAKTVIDKKMNVRQTESYARMLAGQKQAKEAKALTDQEIQYALSVKKVEEQLSKAVGSRVKLKDRNGRGKIEIAYKDLDELDRLLEVIVGPDLLEQN